MHAASRLPFAAAASSKSVQRRLHAAWSRLARTSASRAIWDFTDGRVVDVEDVDTVCVLGLIPVDADDDVLAPIDPGLLAGRGLLDAQLRQAGLDGRGHAAQLLDFVDRVQRARSARSAVRRST